MPLPAAHRAGLDSGDLSGRLGSRYRGLAARPALVRAAAALLAGPLRLGRPGAVSRVANMRGRTARMAAVVTPLTLLIGMACTVLFVQPTLGDAARRAGSRR